MKYKSSFFLIYIIIIACFIIIISKTAFAEEKVVDGISWPTDISEGVLFTEWNSQERLRCIQWYTDELLQESIKSSNERGLIREHGREYFIEHYENGAKTYYFTDMRVSDNKWVYTPGWLPDMDVDPDSSYFIYYPAAYGLQGSNYSSSKTPYFNNFNAYRADENGVFITGLLTTYQEDPPETVVVPKTIGGKPVLGVWMTGGHNSLGYFITHPKRLYIPESCGIVSGPHTQTEGWAEIIRY